MKENKRFLYCIAKLLNYYWSNSLVVIGFWGREWPGYNVLVLLLWFARHCSTVLLSDANYVVSLWKIEHVFDGAIRKDMRSQRITTTLKANITQMLTNTHRYTDKETYVNITAILLQYTDSCAHVLWVWLCFVKRTLVAFISVVDDCCWLVEGCCSSSLLCRRSFTLF